MATFSEMFAQDTVAINYTNAPTASRPALKLPDPTDNLQTVAKKMIALRNVVEDGQSVAVATGYSGTITTVRDPEDIARMGFTPREARQYDAWKRGAQLPIIDWKVAKAPVVNRVENIKRYERRANAMMKLWRVSGLVKENAMWFSQNMEWGIPLVTAMCRVEGAKKNLKGGQSQLSEVELAELQTCHKANAIAMDRVNAVFKEAHRLMKEISLSREMLMAREHALRVKGGQSGKKAKDPINLEYKFEKRRRINSDFDFTVCTTGERGTRPNIMSGAGLQRTSEASNKSPSC